jgi:hypothetical protein
MPRSGKDWLTGLRLDELGRLEELAPLLDGAAAQPPQREV